MIATQERLDVSTADLAGAARFRVGASSRGGGCDGAELELARCAVDTLARDATSRIT